MVKSSNLYWNGFSVPDYSSKLNNRLQTRNGTFNSFVNEILPRSKRKYYIASFHSVCTDWKHFTPFSEILYKRHNYAPMEQSEKWTNRFFFSLWRRQGNNVLKTKNRVIFKSSFVSISHKMEMTDWVILPILLISNEK